MLALTAPSPTFNNRNGNGKHSTPRRRKKRNDSENPEEFSYLKSSVDLTMRFTNAQDPIYFVFEKLEERSVSALMTEFVKDSLFEITGFVSKVMPK